MRCLWCNKTFSNWHATRMAWHLLRMKGKGLAVCNSSIPPDPLAHYCAYHDGTTERREERKRRTEKLMTDLIK